MYHSTGETSQFEHTFFMKVFIKWPEHNLYEVIVFFFNFYFHWYMFVVQNDYVLRGKLKINLSVFVLWGKSKWWIILLGMGGLYKAV